MKVLLADRMDELVVDELRAVGLEVESRPDLTKTTLPQALDGVGILVVRATPVTAEAIEAGKQLNLIVRAGVSTQNIDVQAAAARGIYVASCPGMNAAAVAEIDEQIAESREHAQQFRATLEKAQKRFAALAKVEERHARHYQVQLEKVNAGQAVAA